MEVLAWIVTGIIIVAALAVIWGMCAVGYDAQKAISKAAKDDEK